MGPLLLGVLGPREAGNRSLAPVVMSRWLEGIAESTPKTRHENLARPPPARP